jgi:CBS domain-containing protein
MQMTDTVRAVLDKKGRHVLAVSPETSVYDALRMMAEHDIGALIVLRDGRLAGVFSERDYARKVILHGKASRETSVEEVMSERPAAVTPSHTVQDCMELMTGYRVRHLPVVEDDEVIGMISIGDTVNWIISAQEETIQHLRAFIAGSYPA